MKSKDSKKDKEKDSSGKWLITVSLLSFSLSIVFSFLTTTIINKISVPLAILILLLVILVGIIFDMVSMSVTIAEEKTFHAKASKKLDGAKTSIKLIRNAPKVSSICADVIGDVCGILSGGIGTIVAMKISSSYGIDFDLQVVISAMVAALTIGGKAKCKLIAQEYSEQIVDKFTKVLNFFTFKKSKKNK
jgi:CBS domain containing-hemolysin-like protein